MVFLAYQYTHYFLSYSVLPTMHFLPLRNELGFTLNQFITQKIENLSAERVHHLVETSLGIGSRCRLGRRSIRIVVVVRVGHVVAVAEVLFVVISLHLQAHVVERLLKRAHVVFGRAEIVDYGARLDDLAAEGGILVAQALQAQEAVFEDPVGALDHPARLAMSYVVAPFGCVLRICDGREQVLAGPESFTSFARSVGTSHTCSPSRPA